MPLLRRLGARDAALIVMGGIVGSGIFRNPSVVASFVPNGVLVMLVWVLGGAVALLGAGVFAELAARRPHDGGLYAYMRDAFHPVLAFMYGWTLLLVSQSGGMAAAAVTFAGYVSPSPAFERVLAVSAIAVFTVINALGVRAGASAQNLFMMLKIAAIGGFVVVGLFAPQIAPGTAALPAFAGGSALAAMGLAMVPVLFAYSGWQTSSFMSAELRDPAKTLPRGLVIGVISVVVLYLSVNAVSLHALGIAGLAATKSPASDIAALAFGPAGRTIMVVVVALSTLGFLSNQILTSPRVYFQMGSGLVLQSARTRERTHARADARDRAARRRRDRYRAGRSLRSNSQLRHERRLRLFRSFRARADRLSNARRARSERTEAGIHHAGTPVEHAALSGHRVGYRGRRIDQIAARHIDRPCDSGKRRSRLCDLC
jgi:APA family basic amino acid/polyamine antiporter